MSSSPLSITLMTWAVVTAVFVVLMIYRSLVSMHEEDQLFLDPAASKLESEQREVLSKINRVTPYAKGFGFASLGLLVLSAGLWVYQALQGANTLR